MNSSGSVVSGISTADQIRSPVTVTRPDVTRYFMTISEAMLVIQAGAMTQKPKVGQAAPVYLLDMGEQE